MPWGYVWGCRFICVAWLWVCEESWAGAVARDLGLRGWLLIVGDIGELVVGRWVLVLGGGVLVWG